MKFGMRRHNHESYFTRQKAKYKRRLKKKFIPGYGKHRPFSYKQWKGRNYQRAYRYFTFPSVRSALRAKWEGRNPYDLHGYGRRRRISPQEYQLYKDKKTISNWNIIFIAFLVTMVWCMFFSHFVKIVFFGTLGWLFYLKYKYYWKPLYDIHHPRTQHVQPQAQFQKPQTQRPARITPEQRRSLQAELDDLKASVNSIKSMSASEQANGFNSKAPNSSEEQYR